jgi:hypothetical protein
MPFPCCSPAVLKTDSHIPCRSYAVPMPFPYRDPATTLPFSDSAVSVKVPYLVHGSSPAISFQKLSFTELLSQSLCCKLYKHSCLCIKIISFFSSITNAALFHTGHLATVIWDWYSSDNKLHGTGRSSSKGHKLASREYAVNMPSPCRSHHAMNLPWPWEVAFRKAYSWHGRGTAWERHGMCESNTAALCKSNGKDTI